MNRSLIQTVAAAAMLLFVSGAAIQLSAQNPSPAPATPAAPAAAAPATAVKPANDKTFMELLRQGGIMMIPLGLTSVTMIALVLDGFMRLRNDKLAPPDLVEQLRAQFRTGDYNAAYQTCKARPTFLSNVARVGLSLLGHGKAVAERAMEETLAKEASSMATRIRYLSVIGVVSPMLGLTGTVLGMIRAFSTIGQSGIGDPSALAAAIGEVLVATATGLFVAIPGFAFYYVFTNRITATTAYAEDVLNGLFRGMPYELMVGVEIGDEPIWAGAPHPSLLSRANQPVERAPGPEPAPVPQSAPVAAPAQPVRTVRAGGAAATVKCPACSQPVAVGSPSCPNCQTGLNWGAAA